MLTITEQAAEQLKGMLASEETPNLFLRVGVKPGGCSGFSYGLGFDDEQTADDKEFTQNGLRVIVDAESSKYLYGVVIDYKESDMGGGFVIDNPNAVASCGCGSSFRTATDEGKPEEC
jgi:iron-sulfur cluster assembly protein